MDGPAHQLVSNGSVLCPGKRMGLHLCVHLYRVCTYTNCKHRQVDDVLAPCRVQFIGFAVQFVREKLCRNPLHSVVLEGSRWKNMSQAKKTKFVHTKVSKKVLKKLF